MSKEKLYEELEYDSEEEDDDSDASSALVSFGSTLNLKLMFFLFIIYIILNSNVFIDKILGSINGAVEYKAPTSKGVLIQALLLVLVYTAIDIIVKKQLV